MKIKNINLIFVTLLLFVLAITGVYAVTNQFGGGSSAIYSTYNPSNFGSYYGGEIYTYWPVLGDKDICEARQDLLLQVVPAGCQPVVVRSDIIAEQNVPVFCQIQALKLNPSIEIKDIRSITFSSVGGYPKEVVGTGFHPARAALRTNDRLIGSPLSNNIGYAVVILKKQPNETALPDFINMTLSARIDYDINNGLGIGNTEFSLTPVTEQEWGTEKLKQSFWQGRYSVRMEEAYDNYGIVSIYSGDKKIVTTRVDKGKTSSDIYLPGMYCRAGLQIAYDGFRAADKKARIEVTTEKGTDSFDVYKDSTFLNRCRVSNIDVNNDGTGSVTISCGAQTIRLRLDTGSITETVIPKGTEVINNEVQLGVSVTGAGNEGYYSIKKTGTDWVLYYRKSLEITSPTIKEKELTDPKNKWMATLKNELIARTQGKIAGESTERIWPNEVESKVSDALDSYRNVVEDYPSEKLRANTGEDYYGVKALFAAIELAKDSNKQRSAVIFQDLFLEKYPSTQYTNRILLDKENTLSYDSTKSSSVIKLDNGFANIRLVELSKPRNDEVSAQFSWGGQDFTLHLDGTENKKINGQDASIMLSGSPGVDSAQIKSTCSSTKAGVQTTSSITTITLNREYEICGQQLVLKDTNTAKVAKVRLSPIVRNLGSQTNVSVGIGIEKRAIQLTPDQALSKIDTLNKSIEKWDKLSTNLGTIVTGLKATCFATAGILTVKTFLSGMSGEGISRQEVMRGKGGWNEKCQAIVSQNPGTTLSQCFSENADAINRDVKATAEGYRLTNDKLKDIEGKNLIGSGFGTSKVVNRSAASSDLIKEIRSKYGTQTVKIKQGENTIEKPVNDLIDEGSYDRHEVSYEQLRDMYSGLIVQAGGTGLATDSGKTIASEKLSIISEDVKSRVDDNTLKSGILSSSSLQGTTLAKSEIDAFAPKNSIEGYYDGTQISPEDAAKLGIKDKDITKSTPAKIITYNSQPYLLTLSSQGSSASRFGITSIYKLNKENNYKVVGDGSKLDLNKDENAKAITQRVSVFNKLDGTSYNNYYDNPEVRYYETEPYKGLPALVPVDTQKGWYVATKQNLGALGSSGLQSFKANGRVASFWVCNVGTNHQAEFFTGLGDDVCTEFNLDTGQPLRKFPGLSDKDADRVVQDSISALNEASDKYQAGIRSVLIRGKTYKVGSPASNIPNTQCQDFMDPNDCKILFNVCDPVICPSSRCDFGGKYPVTDVIQTGIVGSTLLCLPNIKEVAIPVCLTGIKAGIDSFVSVMKSYRDCLQENVNSGKTVGICDEIHSIYMCEFFWKQAAPLANILLPKLIESAYSGGQQGTRGGGEYLTVMGAWDNAKKSLDYFTQSYAVNSIKAFNVRSTEEAGSQFCRSFLSFKGPKSIKSLIEPDSPPQFYAKFDSIKFSTATVPPTAQYKVYYHIFGGKDSGVYYSIYLKNPPETSYYYSTPIIQVAQGYIQKGEYASQTRDFTAPEGYKELCVRINDEEQCGFKEVTTNFAINQLGDKYAQQQMTDQNVKTEKACISGNSNALSLANINLQAGVENAINPAIYNDGIVRICSTKNPGSATDNTRFAPVGYCDDPRIICWLDKNSVNNAISQSNVGVKNATLQEVEKMTLNYLGASGELYTVAAADSVIEGLKAEYSVLKKKYDSLTLTKGNLKEATDLLAKIDTQLQKIYLNSQKADLALLKAQIKDIIGRVYLDEAKAAESNGVVVVTPGTTGTTPVDTSTPVESGTYSLGNKELYKNVADAQIIFIDGAPINAFLSQNSKSLIVILNDGTKNSVGTLSNNIILVDTAKIKALLTQNKIDSQLFTHLNNINGKSIDALSSGAVTETSIGTTTTTSSSTPSSVGSIIIDSATYPVILEGSWYTVDHIFYNGNDDGKYALDDNNKLLHFQLNTWADFSKGSSLYNSVATKQQWLDNLQAKLVDVKTKQSGITTLSYKTSGFDENKISIVYGTDKSLGSTNAIFGYETCTATFNNNQVGISKKIIESDNTWKFYTFTNAKWILVDNIISEDIQNLKDDLIVACNRKKAGLINPQPQLV